MLYRGRKRTSEHAEMQARIAADHLLKALETSGFVLMRKPPAPMHSGTDMGLFTGMKPIPLKD